MADTPPTADDNLAAVDNTDALRGIAKRRMQDAMSVLTDTLDAIDESTLEQTESGLSRAVMHLGNARRPLLRHLAGY